MNDWCGHCSHHRDAHRPWGVCDELVPCAGIDWPCRCPGFASVRSLLARRVVTVLVAVAVFASIVGSLGGGPR